MKIYHVTMNIKTILIQLLKSLSQNTKNLTKEMMKVIKSKGNNYLSVIKIDDTNRW